MRKTMNEVINMSKIYFSADQKDKLDAEFRGILRFVDEGGTTGEHRAISSHVLTLDDLAPDTPRPSLPIEVTLMNAPRKRGRYFVVPQVVE